MDKKNFLSALLLLSFCFVVSAQSNDVNIVRQFGTCLSTWASKSNSFSLESMEILCSKNPSFRVGDHIMANLAMKNNITRTDTYDWDVYISCMQKEIDKGVSIVFSDIKQVPASMISRNYKDVQYVSCNVKMSGACNFNETDLFVLKNGKIVKIQEYEVVIDKNGRRKIRVDLSGLDIDDDQEGLGLTYNYSKSFPIGASFNYTKWKMMIGADFGVNLDKDIYTTQKVELVDLMNYKIDRGEYDIKYYITVTPAFYLKYFSIGYGFGFLSMKGTEYTEQNNFSISENGNTIVTGGTSSNSKLEGIEKVKFMMRPNIKGYIPCNDNLFISLSISYNWIPNLKVKSGIDFGVGLQFLMD